MEYTVPAILMNIYIAILLALWWVGKIKPTKWIVASPLLVWLIAFLCLAVPCRFYAPSGSVRAFYAVVPIVPNVKGVVVDIPIKANVSLKKGEVLFRIDPRPFQYKVDKLKAALAKANMQAGQLASSYEAAAAVTRESRNALTASESENDRMARESVEAAKAAVAQAQANVDFANQDLKRKAELVKDRAVSQEEYDRAERAAAGQKAQLDQASSALRKAEENIKASSGHLGSAREAVAEAEANEKQARLALDAKIDGENPDVRQIMADLDNAQWELEQTEVRAPADGYVSNVALRPGGMVSNLPMAPAMAFVTRERALGMFVQQAGMRYIKPGLETEVALEIYPGTIFKGKVISIVEGNHQGQIQPSGTLTSETAQRTGAFTVWLEPGPELEKQWLPPGTGGAAVIYTKHGKFCQFAEVVLIRVRTYANYIF